MARRDAPRAEGAAERARQFCEGLRGLGYDVFTGVPCSLLREVYVAVTESRASYYPATREDLAIGLAAGFALAGRRCAVLMQNSGLGVSPNVLLSLVEMYRLPVLLVVTWRGEGSDAPEHVGTGRTMIPLLRALGVPYRLAGEPRALDPAFHAHAGPIALIVRRGEFCEEC
jgi:phosphonopyruvate decarboxylase